MTKQATTSKSPPIAIAPYPVTIYCEDYDKVAVYNSSAYSLTEPIYLTQAETVINIPKSNNYVTVKPISSDYIVNLTVTGNALTSSYSPGQVSIEGDDVRIEVAVEKIARDMQMAVYLDEAEWIFDYCTVLLSNYKATEHKCFLQNGYQVINFGDFDTISTSPSTAPDTPRPTSTATERNSLTCIQLPLPTAMYSKPTSTSPKPMP